MSSTTNKAVAVIGFVIAIIFLLWLAVQIVGFLPSAFSSLASIADGVQNYRPTESISVSTQNSVVNANAPFTITWGTIENEGTFTFVYECDTAATLLVTVTGDTSELACGEELTFTEGSELTIEASSPEQRFTDVAYTLTFTPERGEAVSDSDTITIVNATIPAGGLATDNDDDTDDVPSTDVATDDTDTTDTPSTGTGNETYYRTVETVTYEIPTSDPNGYTDLEVKFVAVGIIDTNGNFRRTGTLETGEAGAIRFMVKNIGTKTSDDWTFDAELPSDIDYTSDEQVGLKPNEQSLLTISFGGLNRTGVEPFKVTIDTDEDANNANDHFNWAITVVD